MQMIFYIHPPLLDVPLDLLRDICCKRMALLIKIDASEGDVEAIRRVLEQDDTCHECLHEGTTEDLVSHFVVRFGHAEDLCGTFVISPTLGKRVCAR